MTDERNPEHFLSLIKKSRRGKFKLYIGMVAGVGKTYRMLQEAHALLKNGVDVRIGYIETHRRKETHALLDGLPEIPRWKIFYKGKELEEMDVQAILNIHPELVLVDELAHTNIPGSKNEKRWQDVVDILESGINVISAVNIQHLESLNDQVKQIAGLEVAERVPDNVLQLADEIVNIDLPADELIQRLKDGKIYPMERVPTALNNFFREDKILQLRELALKEVAQQVEHRIETRVTGTEKLRIERFLACISSNHEGAKRIIRKTARLASYYHASWMLLYVQTSREATDKINLTQQRHLLNNLKTAAELGAEIIRRPGDNVADVIYAVCEEKKVTTIVIGKPRFSVLSFVTGSNLFEQLLKKTSDTDIDLIIAS